MSKFIKLTNMLLNTKYIYKVVINPKKYQIYMIYVNDSLNCNFIEVCETKHSTDYLIISEWIRND